MSEAEASKETENPISDEDMAFLTKSVWESLLKPKWSKDDLIDFGKAIFAKKTLKEMDDKIFDRVFPFLRQVSTTLAERLSARANATISEEKNEIVGLPGATSSNKPFGPPHPVGPTNTPVTTASHPTPSTVGLAEPSGGVEKKEAKK